MRCELDNFIFESDINIDFFDDVVNYAKDNEKFILDFFKLDKLPNKFKIIILSYKSFKDFIISKYGEILDYVCGDSDSSSKTIRILNVDDQIKYTSHKDASIDKIKSTILHEIVHQCHHIFHNDCNQIVWFAEGLATNLSKQDNSIVDLNNCDFNRLKNDFRHYNGNYNCAHTIVNYILNNYSRDEVEKLYSNLLRKRADFIFLEEKNNLIFKKN